ncbi:hypothetical protein FDECE_13137 [Fusarium decemcellulare]|nr:hypothetical protein FDECE_13137 [Fusarium decemcellulare]
MLPDIATICNTARNVLSRATTLETQMVAIPARVGAIEYTIVRVDNSIAPAIAWVRYCERIYRALPDVPESNLDKDDDIENSDKDDNETDGRKPSRKEVNNDDEGEERPPERVLCKRVPAFQNFLIAPFVCDCNQQTGAHGYKFPSLLWNSSLSSRQLPPAPAKHGRDDGDEDKRKIPLSEKKCYKCLPCAWPSREGLLVQREERLAKDCLRRASYSVALG